MTGGDARPESHLHYQLEPPLADRMALEAAPRERTVKSYITTRAAHHALSLLTQRYQSGAGGLFWISGPPGAGKTHFLNFLIALRLELSKAGQGGRELIVALDYPQVAGAAQLLNDLLAALAKELGGGERRANPLWRRIGAEAAFEVALGAARRAGVGTISAIIDFGADGAPSACADLARIAQSSTRPMLVVVAAGRGAPAQGATLVEAGPAGEAERCAIAIGRARRLEAGGDAMARLYDDLELAPFAPADIFPFHPETARTIAAIDESGAPIAGPSRLAREALAARRQAALIYPCDLFEAPALRSIIGERLGADGRAALRRADAAIAKMARPNRQPAQSILRTLALAYLYDREPAVQLAQLWKRLPGGAPARQVLRQLAASGAVMESASHAAFVPLRSSGPDCEQFNRALPALRLFDPGLGQVNSPSALNAAVARVELALANLLEDARRVGTTLMRFGEPGPEVRQSIDAMVTLAEGGARTLVEKGRDPSTEAIVAAYQETAAAAAAIPALLAMKDYLRQTRLEPENIDRREYPEVVALAAERHLLEAELGPRAPYSHMRDALLARLEKFKRAYVEQYRDGHERWRADMRAASLLVADSGRYHQALMRLDSIAALGPPLAAQFLQLENARFAVCDLSEPFNAHAAAICPRCNYRLGTPSPLPDLNRRMELIGRALREKLTRLSRGAIARLIKKYDRAHRLDGFLKITQAAQTEALAAVLDDDLSAYIARLLESGDSRAMKTQRQERG